MSLNNVILLLGTNLFDKEMNLRTAENYLKETVGKILKDSETIETEPIGFESKNAFLNKTVYMQTGFSPIELLKKVKEIETRMGRKYDLTVEGYQDRIIDIDILHFNSLIYKSKILNLPHPQIITRNFVKTLLNYSCNK